MVIWAKHLVQAITWRSSHSPVHMQRAEPDRHLFLAEAVCARRWVRRSYVDL